MALSQLPLDLPVLCRVTARALPNSTSATDHRRLADFYMRSSITSTTGPWPAGASRGVRNPLANDCSQGMDESGLCHLLCLTRHMKLSGRMTVCSASIFAGREDVYTCSFHAANNFPTRKQRSTLDVPLPDGMQDDDYCRCVRWTHTSVAEVAVAASAWLSMSESIPFMSESIPNCLLTHIFGSLRLGLACTVSNADPGKWLGSRACAQPSKCHSL